ncbi:MAG TPA: HicB family protein [Cyanobacteria bacterium UBA8530]|nr:HicB family protein [Cyanobacteria bacterium UBA8530]
MDLTIELREGSGGEWFAKVSELPETVSYGESPLAALAQTQALALHFVAGMVARGELPPEQQISFNPLYLNHSPDPQDHFTDMLPGDVHFIG